jgi:hypothetical protein
MHRRRGRLRTDRQRLGPPGWTVGTLKALSLAELRAALAMAHTHGIKVKKPAKRRT